MITEICLSEDLFPRERRRILSHGGITVDGFCYASGVRALEVDTGAARFVLLPFQGQQIWDAWVGERRLTMQSVFDTPIPTREFRRTYGAFFVHCGATAMGSPQPGEIHMPHGELPNIPFESASLILGSDNGLASVALTGLARDLEAFSHAYAFRPSLRFVAGGTDVTADIAVENTGGADMPLMYLGHVNFRPVGGGVLVDGAKGDPSLSWTKPALPPHASAAVHAWHDAVAADFDQHRAIGAGDPVEPEFVKTMRLPAGADGWAHALQLLPDGSADYVSYRPGQLQFGVRWITRAPERQALGVILPSTAGPEGRAAARAAGHLLSLAPGEVFTANMRFGVLPPADARRMIDSLPAN